MPILRSGQLTEAQRTDATNYLPGDVIVFHRRSKQFRPGERLTVGADGTIAGHAIPVAQASRFDLFYADRLPVAPGEVLRITRNGKSLEGRALDNGTLHRVDHFDRDGNLVTDKGWTISRDYGHLAAGYTTTSPGSQGKSVNRVFVAQSSRSAAAASMRQFYVSAGRGQEMLRVFTDSKAELLEAVSKDDERLSATQVFGNVPRRARALAARRQRELTVNKPLILERKEVARDR
ncbi:MAG: hypothetical protein QM770_07580 [Tepidisphaeraceae bacterium]